MDWAAFCCCGTSIASSGVLPPVRARSPFTFLMAWSTGSVNSPDFEQWFYRFAQYELIEGQHLAPALLMPRLYYTLPLALGFAALTALVETDWCRCPGHLFFTGFLLFITALLNLRLGPLFWAVGCVYLVAGSKNDGLFRLQPTKQEPF